MAAINVDFHPDPMFYSKLVDWISEWPEVLVLFQYEGDENLRDAGHVDFEEVEFTPTLQEPTSIPAIQRLRLHLSQSDKIPASAKENIGIACVITGDKRYSYGWESQSQLSIGN
jgi:hypothetical protein